MGESVKNSLKNELKEIIAKKGGNIMSTCFQCGECGSVCPIGYIKNTHSPRKILYKLAMGDQDILDSEDLWLCTTCFSCAEVCPKDVDPQGIFIEVRNYVCKSGRRPPGRIKSMVATITTDGMMLPIIGRAKRMRDDMNLAEIKTPDMKKISKILGNSD